MKTNIIDKILGKFAVLFYKISWPSKKKRNILYINDFGWDAEEQKIADIWFDIDGKTYNAFGDVREDLTGCWIHIEFSPLLLTELTENEILSKNPCNEKKLIKGNYFYDYYAYGQIIGINPLSIDCGDLMLICDNLLTTSDVDFNYRKYLNKYIYFVVDRIDIWRYELIYKDKFRKRNNGTEFRQGAVEPSRARTKIYVKYPIWSPDKSESSVLSIQFNGISEIAYGHIKEDLTGCWIDAEFHCNLSYKSVISFKKNLNNEIKFKLGGHPIEGYDAYGKIICTDPLIVYCGDITLTIDNPSFESAIELSSEKHLNKYIYFKPSGFHITSYEIISRPSSKMQMPINIKIWADYFSTGLFTEIGEPLYQEDTEITDDTWSELQRLVRDYEKFIPGDDETKKEYKEKIPEFDARGLTLMKRIKKEWPVERKTGREINFRYYSEGLMKFID